MQSYCGETIEENQVPSKSFPGFAQALWIILLSIIVVIPVSLIVYIISFLINIKTINEFAKYIPLHIACLIVLFYFFKRYIKQPFHEAFFLNRFSIKIILPMLVTILGLGILLSELDNLFKLILPMPKLLQGIHTQYLYNQQNIIPIIISTVLFAPIAEELMCRGLILHGFLGRYRSSSAIILSSLLFAIWHLNPWQLIGAFVIGCFLGWICVNARSLYPCIIAHAFHNLLPKILLYTKIRVPGLTSEQTAMPHVFQPFWLDLCGVLLIIVGIFTLGKLFSNKHN